MNAETKARHREMNLEMGAIVLDRIAARGISLRALSRAVGMNSTTLRNKLVKGSRINMIDLFRIARALDCDPGDLLPVSLR